MATKRAKTKNGDLHRRTGEAGTVEARGRKETDRIKEPDEILERRVEERRAALADSEPGLRKVLHELESQVSERTRELEEANATILLEKGRFDGLLETLPAYVILLTPDHHVQFANRFFRERFGESGGRRCYEYLFHRTEPCRPCETFTVLETNSPHRWEWTGPDGRNYDIFDYPFVDADGSTLVMEVGIDITEQKQAQERLREVNETLEMRIAERTREMESTNVLLRDSRLAALNMMEDAIAARKQTEAMNAELQHEVSERKYAEGELLRLNKVLKALSDSSQAVIRAKDEPEYLNDVCRIIVEDCGYCMVWIGFAEKDGAKSIRPVAHAGFEDGYLETLDLTWADRERGKGPTGTAIRTGQVAACRNMLSDPLFAPWRDEAIRRGYASSIVFPLRIDGAVFGAITIYSKEPDPFSEGEVRFLTELSDNLAYGIRVLRIRAAQQQAERSLKKSLGRFELLTATAGDLLQSTEPQRVVESVCHKVMEYLDCHAFFNFLSDEQSGKLRLNACAGISEEEARKIEWLDYGVAVCGCAARDAQRIVAEHIPTTPDERTILVKSYGIKAYCCHPLIGPGGKVIGTLSFGTCSRETFGEEDISLMKAVADQVTAAMIRIKNEADVLKLGEDMAARNVQLESVNSELESFIYSISHDLRAPLRSIGGFANILEEDYSENLNRQGRDYLSRIKNGAERMTLLIDDLLNLARVSRQEMQRTQVDLTAMANTIVSSLREADPGRSAEVVIAGGLNAFADKRLAEIVLLNVLSNAWKFTSKKENARIEFGAASDAPISSRRDTAVYYVRDNGAGFDPNYAEKLFRPFHRLHSDSEFEGTGIGLTIVERIIRRHGGRIYAEGEIGKGATVYFTLE